MEEDATSSQVKLAKAGLLGKIINGQGGGGEGEVTLGTNHVSVSRKEISRKLSGP